MDIIIGILVIAGIIVIAAAFWGFNETIPINLMSFEYMGASIFGTLLMFVANSNRFSTDNRIVLAILSLLILGYTIVKVFKKLSMGKALISIFFLIIGMPLTIIAILMAVMSFSAARDMTCGYRGEDCY